MPTTTGGNVAVWWGVCQLACGARGAMQPVRRPRERLQRPPPSPRYTATPCCTTGAGSTSTKCGVAAAHPPTAEPWRALAPRVWGRFRRARPLTRVGHGLRPQCAHTLRPPRRRTARRLCASRTMSKKRPGCGLGGARERSGGVAGLGWRLMGRARAPAAASAPGRPVTAAPPPRLLPPPPPPTPHPSTQRARDPGLRARPEAAVPRPVLPRQAVWADCRGHGVCVVRGEGHRADPALQGVGERGGARGCDCVRVGGRSHPDPRPPPAPPVSTRAPPIVRAPSFRRCKSKPPNLEQGGARDGNAHASRAHMLRERTHAHPAIRPRPLSPRCRRSPNPNPPRASHVHDCHLQLPRSRCCPQLRARRGCAAAIVPARSGAGVHGSSPLPREAAGDGGQGRGLQGGREDPGARSDGGGCAGGRAALPPRARSPLPRHTHARRTGA